mgnify:CR=1 FL=1
MRHLLDTLRTVSQRLPLVFALHPRTRSNIDRFGLADLIDAETESQRKQAQRGRIAIDFNGIGLGEGDYSLHGRQNCWIFYFTG